MEIGLHLEGYNMLERLLEKYFGCASGSSENGSRSLSRLTWRMLQIRSIVSIVAAVKIILFCIAEIAYRGLKSPICFLGVYYHLVLP
jgi:hypothetical protein